MENKESFFSFHFCRDDAKPQTYLPRLYNAYVRRMFTSEVEGEG